MLHVCGSSGRGPCFEVCALSAGMRCKVRREGGKYDEEEKGEIRGGVGIGDESTNAIKVTHHFFCFKLFTTYEYLSHEQRRESFDFCGFLETRLAAGLTTRCGVASPASRAGQSLCLEFLCVRSIGRSLLPRGRRAWWNSSSEVDPT